MPQVPTGRPPEPTPHAAYRGRALRRWALPELTLSEDRYDADLALPTHAQRDHAPRLAEDDQAHPQLAPDVGEAQQEVGR